MKLTDEQLESLEKIKAQFVRLNSATIRSEADMEVWLAEARQTIKLALNNGPVVLR